ncbi:hypothetical protein [Nocardioides montaniterrae]
MTNTSTVTAAATIVVGRVRRGSAGSNVLVLELLGSSGGGGIVP